MGMRLAISLALWVVVLACMLAPSTAQLTQVTQKLTPSNVTGRPLRGCSSERPPMTFCQPGQTSLQTIGLTPDLFRAAADRIEWTEGIDYVFECVTMRSQDIVTDLAADNSTCDAGISAIVVTAERTDNGIQFAWPYVLLFSRLSSLLYIF
jgi:hypothetical protein